MVGFCLGFCVTLALSLILLQSKRKLVIRIKPELQDVQKFKNGTPTIGGIAFTCAVSLVAWICGLSAIELLAMWIFALIGLWDDLEKTHSRNGDGLKSLTKLGAQCLAAFLVVLMLGINHLVATNLSYSAFAIFFFVFMVNAVNISDGLDGLAALMALPVLCLVAWFGRDPFLLAFIGALLAFLLLNLKPAKYFMGDAGSHALGAVIALVALIHHLEGAVIIASIPFMVELMSSLIQILAIRLFGRKVFLIAPLHHDLQKRGMGERQVVFIFFCASLCTTSLALWLVNRGGFV